MDIVPDILSATEQSIFIASVVSKTTLLVPKTSNAPPAGIGASLTRKEVVFETEYNQGEQYQESKKQVEEVEEAYPETDAIVLDELSDVSPIIAPKEEGGKLTWLILLAAGIGLVAYGWFN